MSRLLIAGVLLLGLVSALHGQDEGKKGDLVLTAGASGTSWTEVAPEGTCSCGRTLWPVYTNLNFRVSIYHHNMPRFQGCLECLLACVDSCGKGIKKVGETDAK